MKYPKLDFVGIGAAKAATTWIAQCLAEHPGICMSDPKELNFFARRILWPPLGESRYSRGPSWLAKRFRHCRPDQAKGEFSPSYLVDSESPAILRKEMPQARLIVSLRNPADCIYSLYFNYRRQLPVPNTFEGMLEKYPSFLDRGDYFQHLQRFFAQFPREQLCIVLLEDIRENPLLVMRRLFAHIGVDPEFEPPSLRSRVNEWAEPRALWLRNLIAGGRTVVRATPSTRAAREVLRAVGVERLANWAERKNWRAGEPPPMKGETRKYLQERYGPGNHQLGELLGRDLDHWV